MNRILILVCCFYMGGCGAVGYTRVVQGTPGPTGASGLDGQNGETGAEGPKGDVGLVGPIGPIGAQGIPGIQGPTGAVGANGSAGIQGIPGLDGTNGADGVNGSSVTTVKFCADDTSAFPEYGIVIGSSIYAVYWGSAPYSPSTSEAFLALIKPGNYQSTGGNGCNFTVNSNGTVTE